MRGRALRLAKPWVLMAALGGFLGAQTFEDPVMKARLQRAESQGIEEADLPPVPRSVMEPPPLPPPEMHAKDAPHPKVAKSSRRRGGKARAGKQAPAEVAAPAPRVRTARPARPVGKAAPAAGKAARRTGKRVKG